jgi:hypothetical protein
MRANNNRSIMTLFLYGQVAHTRRGTLVARVEDWEGTNVSALFLALQVKHKGEVYSLTLAGHDWRFGYVLNRQIEGPAAVVRRARRVQDDLIKVIDNPDRWVWNE